jgi:uncharacterized protein YecT (DUF1311 family)
MAWRGGVWALAALFALAAPWRGPALAAAPSFDCTAAAAPVEILICGNDELGAADAGLALLYRRLQDVLDDKAKADLVAGQRQWLKARLATCGIPAAGKAAPAEVDRAAACLIGQYKERTDALTKLQEAANPIVVPVEDGLPTALGLDRKTVPATGEQQSILSVAQFGRYSVTVKSAQGVALQLVDRKAGPGEIQGVAGESDGRIDAFLDRGLYKLVLHASEQGSGDAAITVHPYAELNGSDLPRLPEVKRIDAELGDFQQRSYWLEIKERRIVAIEAAGRNLADMRLWRDGNWLVDASPSEDQIEPEAGNPLAVRRIVTTLEPGFYLLAVYGGPELPWAKTSAEHPFHIRMGIPTLGESGRQTFIASPLGIDRYLVPTSANYFRIELPEAEDASLSVDDYSETVPFNEGGNGDSITKKSVPPVAEYREFGSSIQDSGGWRVVTIHRAPGKPYVLQQFKSVDFYSFNGDGDYWIETLHSGHGEDNVDATALLTRSGADVPERIIADSVPKLNRIQPFQLARFNFLEPFTVYLRVTSPDAYIVSESGIEGEYRFEPMFSQRPKDYQPPAFQPAGYPWKLDSGYYILTGMPKSNSKGIADIRIFAQGVAGSGTQRAKETAVLFPKQRLESSFRYTLYLNQQPDVEAGVVLRKLPVDLAAGLPLTLKAEQELEIPIKAPTGGIVRAVAEDASALRFSIDGKDDVTEWRGDGAEHALTITNPTDKAMMASLQFTPDSLAPDTPLPKIAPEILAAIRKFPSLEPQKTIYFDIAKGEHRTFALDIAEAGLYRVESSGLLQTEGNMRTRTVISLDAQANNGTGRNFLLQQYLGQGAYQVTVAAQGETHGRMGVTTAPTLMKDGGALSLDVPARDTIQSGDGLVYTFKIEAAGQYRLQSLGLGRTFTMRLEDQDGWPIIAPNAPADLTMDFKSGTYRLVILPQPVEAKIVILLQRIEEPKTIEGHGPHDLVLNRPQEFQWREPEEGEERVPDQWRFVLPAAAHVAITLNQGMRADLVGEDGKTLREVIGGDNWQGELPSGVYTLRTTSFEPNNRFDYTVSVHVTELVAGLNHVTNLPADIPVSIGSDSVVEIGSFGTTDVRAWLYDAKGRLAASNDDRPNDWNFAIAGRLPPGYYRLHLEAVNGEPTPGAPQPAVTDTVEDGENDQMTSGDAEASGEGESSEAGEYAEEGEAEAAEPAAEPEAAPGQTVVSIYQPEEQIEGELAVGEDIDLTGPKVHVVPLTTAPGDLLVAAADAKGPAVGLSLERKEGEAWSTLSETVARSPWVALPVKGLRGEYRLRVWSADRSAEPIRLQTRMLTRSPAGAAQLTGRGVKLTPIAGVFPALGVAAVAVNFGGAYQVDPSAAGVTWSTENGRALAEHPLGIAFGMPGTFWFAARTDDATPIIARRVTPGDAPIALTVPGFGEGETDIVDTTAAIGQPHLWLADSRLGQPGIGGPELTSATAQGSAIAVALGLDHASAGPQLWNNAAGVMPLPITLRRFDFAPPVQEALKWGVADRNIKRHQALTFMLPAGLKRLSFALPPQTAVILRAGKQSEGIWSGGSPLALSRDSAAEQLTVLSISDAEAQIGLSLTPIEAGGAFTTLGGGRIFKQYFATEGVVRLDVHLSDGEKKPDSRKQTTNSAAGEKNLHLMVGGAVEEATLMRAYGTVSREVMPMVDSNALVDIAHGPGLVVAWIDGGDPLTSLGVATQAIQVRETSAVQLAGSAQQIVFATENPKFLRLKTTSPVIAELEPAQRLRVFPNGADLSLLLPAGTTPVVLHAAGDGPLSGLAEASLLEIAPIGEGLGPKVRLTPGESRLYSFKVKDERDIGVGVRGAVDSAHCRVLDAEGNQVGSGVVQMLHLKPGTYLLAVDAPAEGNAIEVQPALVGVAAPDGSPPDDVKRVYLELAGLKPQKQE